MFGLEVILPFKRPVALPDVKAVTEFAYKALFNQEDQLKTSLQLILGHIPRLLDVPFGHNQHMARHFMRVAQKHLSQIVLFDWPVIFIGVFSLGTEWTHVPSVTG